MVKVSCGVETIFTVVKHIFQKCSIELRENVIALKLISRNSIQFDTELRDNVAVLKLISCNFIPFVMANTQTLEQNQRWY